MKLIDAEILANKLMQEHGLVKTGWVFGWQKSRSKFGVCNYSKKTIFLSLELVRLNDLYEVTDTILHEIAHAIAGHKAGHGTEWKKVCIQIGCKPVATFNSQEAITNCTKFIAVCNQCNKEHISDTQKQIYCWCQIGEYKKEFLNWASRSISNQPA